MFHTALFKIRIRIIRIKRELNYYFSIKKRSFSLTIIMFAISITLHNLIFLLIPSDNSINAQATRIAQGKGTR